MPWCRYFCGIPCHFFFRTKVKTGLVLLKDRKGGLQSRNTVEVSSMQTKCSIQNDFQRMNIQILHLSWFHISCNGTQNNWTSINWFLKKKSNRNGTYYFLISYIFPNTRLIVSFHAFGLIICVQTRFVLRKKITWIFHNLAHLIHLNFLTSMNRANVFLYQYYV